MGFFEIVFISFINFFASFADTSVSITTIPSLPMIIPALAPKLFCGEAPLTST